MAPDEWVTLAFGSGGVVFGGIIGPALSWFTEGGGQGHTLYDIRAAARSGSRERMPRTSRPRTVTPDDELVGWAVAALVVIILYVKWRPWILVGLAILSGTVGLAAGLVVVIAWARHVIAGTKTVMLRLIMPFFYSVIGIWVAALLWRTPFAPPVARGALAVCHLRLDAAGLAGINYLAYEILGGAVYVTLALGTLQWHIAILAAIYSAENVRPNRFWRLIASYLSLPLGWGWVIWGFVLATIAVLLSGGWAYTWLSHLHG